MKARFYSMFLSLMFMAGTGYATTSELLLNHPDVASMYVIFDGEVFDPGNAPLELFEVTPGRHSIDVYRFIKDSRGYYTRYAELVYQGSLTFGARERLVAKLTMDGRLLVLKRIKLQPVHYGNTPGHGNSGGGTGYNGHGQGGSGSQGYNGHGSGGGSNSGYNSHYGSSVPSAYELSLLLKTISDASFEQTKLAIAKESLASRSITAEQVYQIMMRFSFEATKLEFAKWAYIRTIDRNNYFTVHRAFSFDSSKKELTRYIATLH